MEKIVCRQLSFAYPKSEYQALKNVDFSVENGEFCLVIGKSAAGKSTLLKLMKKEIAPFGTLDGDIEIFGSVGYVAQNVEENIVCDKVRSELSFGLTNMGMHGEQIDLLVAETASYFNLESKLDSDISSLSGGEKQMVNLAAVMIMKPDILVLDEPTSQLDPVSSERFIQMIKRLHREFGIRSTTFLTARQKYYLLTTVFLNAILRPMTRQDFCGHTAAESKKSCLLKGVFLTMQKLFRSAAKY